MSTTTELDKAIDLIEDAEETTDDAAVFAACVRELTEAVNAGRITREHRTELGGDMLALAESLTAYALRVLA